MKKVLMGFGIFLGVMMLAGCGTHTSTADIPAVRPLKLERYLGTWYEAARLPHRFERGMDRVTATYSANADGTIRVVNRGFRSDEEHTVTGTARVREPGTGELEVSFFRPFYGKYRVIFHDEVRGAAIVTPAARDHVWILIRDPGQAAGLLPELVKKLDEWGFDTSRLEYPALR